MTKLGIGTNHCQCPVCGEYFTTPANFDAHRTGKFPERRCVHPSRLVDKNGKARYSKTARGLWARTGGAFKGKP